MHGLHWGFYFPGAAGSAVAEPFARYGPSGGLDSAASSPHVSQSSPKSSDGCSVATLPLPHISASVAQYLSQPQQTRSGCLGWIGNFFAMTGFSSVWSAQALVVSNMGHAVECLDEGAGRAAGKAPGGRQVDVLRAGLFINEVISLRLRTLLPVRRRPTGARRH